MSLLLLRSGGCFLLWFNFFQNFLWKYTSCMTLIDGEYEISQKVLPFGNIFFIFSLSLATEKSFLCVKWNENIFKLSFFYFLAICQNWINHGNITRIVPWIYDYYFLKINWPQDKYNPGFYRRRVKAQIPESKMM